MDNQRKGAHAELLVAARLCEAGHKVAKPLWDDDGVDLVVNYGIKVQVKSSGSPKTVSETNGKKFKYHIFSSKTGKLTGDKAFADVYVFIGMHDGVSTFWVVPSLVVRAEVAGSTSKTHVSIALWAGAGGRSARWEQYIDAWHSFD